MEIVWFTGIVFFIGLFLGSFLNVVADRLVNDESVIFGRSHCDNCKKILGFFELIPVASFLWQKGRCKGCHIKLSWWYPISEIGTGLLLALTFFVTFGSPLFTLHFILFTTLLFLIIFFADAKYGLIPLPVVICGVVATLIFLVFMEPTKMGANLLASVVVSGLFLLVFLVTRRKGIGFGDVIFAVWMGLLLGLPKSILALYIAFLTGAIVALILVLTGRKKLRGGTIAFGPFLIIGTVVALLWGDTLLAYVLQYFF